MWLEESGQQEARNVVVGQFERRPQNAESGRLRFLKPPALLVRKEGPKTAGLRLPAARCLAGESHSDGLGTISPNCVKWKPLGVVAGQKLSTGACV